MCTWVTHMHPREEGVRKNLNEDRTELLLMIFLSQTPRWHTQQRRFFVVVLFFVFYFALTELKPMALCFLCSTTELPPQSVFLRHHLTTCPRLTQNCGPPASVSLGSAVSNCNATLGGQQCPIWKLSAWVSSGGAHIVPVSSGCSPFWNQTQQRWSHRAPGHQVRHPHCLHSPHLILAHPKNGPWVLPAVWDYEGCGTRPSFS